MIKPKVVLLIFVSGKIVLTGAKVREEIYTAFNQIYTVLAEFRSVLLLLLAMPNLCACFGKEWMADWSSNVLVDAGNHEGPRSRRPPSSNWQTLVRRCGLTPSFIVVLRLRRSLPSSRDRLVCFSPFNDPTPPSLALPSRLMTPLILTSSLTKT